MPPERRRRPIETGTPRLADLQTTTPRVWLRKHRVGVLVSIAALLMVISAVSQDALVGMAGFLLAGWVFLDKVTDRPPAPRPPGPIPASDLTFFLPTLDLVVRSEPGAPKPEAMFVAAGQGGARRSWFAGGGVGLSRSGMVTAADGRGLVEAWDTQTGGVRPGERNTRSVNTGLAEAVATGPRRVVEIAAVEDAGYVYRVYLRNERGEQLAALPAAGLDEPRLVALARAAGIQYRRYRVADPVGYLTSPIAVNCFPLAASFVQFDGPGTPVSTAAWARGRTAMPA